MRQSDSDEIKGDLFRIIHIDEEFSTIFVRYADGKTARLTNTELSKLKKNSVILSNNEKWTVLPEEVWPRSLHISVIRAILNDGTILGESGNTLLVLGNPSNLEVKPDFTVEIDGPTSEICRVVAQEPIRVLQHPADEQISPASFLVRPQSGDLTFDDFGGYRNVVIRAKELIETQLERHAELEKIGARPVKGILFTGPPGTGKTHLARIIANQAGANFYDISGPSIVSKWVGDTEDLLRKIFYHAKHSDSGKSIIFFDEIDSIAESRTGASHEASRRLVAQFLTLMDGFDSSQNATVVIAATNRADALDPALTRPGRFDWEIEFGLPTLSDRLEILKIGARRIQCSEDLPFLDIARRSHDWSAARLTSIWTEAAIIAASDRRTRIAGEDMAQAYERVARRPDRKTESPS
ncbi:AAA family ATPase [Zavarzinia compransoris]|uniref:ATP-binding protein n=1 Tax=Zavarzinia marina TaxID=2911065 RepID=UPI001F198CF6|nr:AAA family ATPase [Zavarzinia marina]MCF4167534.1 AAA family ATPase [Zavarzinia marina]